MFPLPDKDSGGPYMSCMPATQMQGNKLTDVQKYINFFTLPAAQGGVKIDPNDVILASITAPPTPVGEKLTTPCADATAPSCTVLAHSCVAPAPVDAMGNPLFFGDPAVRISSVVNAVKLHQQTSICDTDYTSAIQGIGDIIVSQIGAGCLNSPVENRPGTNTPDCVVEDVTSNTDGTTTIKSIPACDPNSIMPTCWRVVQKPQCPPVPNPMTGMNDQIGISICRSTACDPAKDSSLAPPNTTARVSCATIAHAN
jgi:hypothetical protein